MMNTIPHLMGESETLRSIRSSQSLPGMASFLRPDPDRNISLIKFHRDLHDSDFAAFEATYRDQYMSFHGKFLMIFDL